MPPDESDVIQGKSLCALLCLDLVATEKIVPWKHPKLEILYHSIRKPDRTI
jgi:hypothetical protein